MIAEGLSDIGIVRNSNQDSFYVSDNKAMPLFILADGMGGYSGGEYASQTAVDTVVKIFKENYKKIEKDTDVINLIEESINKSNSSIHSRSLSEENLKGMGTTLIVLYIFAGHLYIGHVGDSRLYYIDDSITQLTDDHSLVNELIKNGEISKEEARNHPQKNLITRAVGTNYIVKPDILRYNYTPNDYVLICSDGLVNMVCEEEIYKIIKSSENLKNINKLLIEKANNNGGKDNITTIVIKL